jgi:uncharacterized Zn finger protein
MRENYRTKGARYVTEGRLTITAITPTLITATVRGAGEIYTVTADSRFWNCTCPSCGPCSHIWAAQLVVLKPRTP